MHPEYSWIRKVRFFASVSSLYVLTLGFTWYVVQSATVPRPTVHAVTTKPSPPPPAEPEFVLVSGKPVRIVIADSGIDLAVGDGYYNEADGSWTLSPDQAHYAMISFLANNHSGNTFLYGHGTDQVFGPLGTRPPVAGTVALVYTDNGHIFSYSFDSLNNLSPDDTSVFSYEGPPILTLQTCTGLVSEWRAMYQFNFTGVIR